LAGLVPVALEGRGRVDRAAAEGASVVLVRVLIALKGSPKKTDFASTERSEFPRFVSSTTKER
jgi:hypothetical protein